MGNNGEAIRRAVKWLSDQRVEKPEANPMKLVDFVENNPKKEGS